MATLTENVARVTSALDDIKNAIIDKGVTPSGKCETFAQAIAEIPTGVKAASGEFTTSATGATINLGFAPKRIIVYSNPEAGTYNEAAIWDVNGLLRKVRTSAATGSNNGGITAGGIAVNGQEFTHNAYSAQFANKKAYYIAIG